MDDKNLIENLLQLEKGVCDLYMHGSLESSTNNVHCTFETALDDSTKMQNEIYKQMEQKGWYPTEQVEQSKIDQLKQQFSSGC